MSSKGKLAKATRALQSPARMEALFKGLEEAAGGREGLMEVLSHAAPNSESSYILGLIADPMNDSRSLTSICAEGGIAVGQLLQVLKDAKGAKALFEAFDRINTYLPRVAEDVARRSLPHSATCEACKGSGFTAKRNAKGQLVSGKTRIPCRACDGKGKLEVMPDLERQKLTLQMGGALKPAGSVQVQVNTQQNFGFAPEHRRDFRSATDRLLFPGKYADEDVVDADLSS